MLLALFRVIAPATGASSLEDWLLVRSWRATPFAPEPLAKRRSLIICERSPTMPMLAIRPFTLLPQPINATLLRNLSPKAPMSTRETGAELNRYTMQPKELRDHFRGIRRRKLTSYHF